MDSTNIQLTETDNEVLIENRLEQNLVKKPRIAKMLDVGKRTVDNYMAKGMPHRKSSARLVRFDEEEVLKWYKEQFGLQRRKSLANN
jgi:predicted DNA-binding transcriptional regulator AlpA